MTTYEEFKARYEKNKKRFIPIETIKEKTDLIIPFYEYNNEEKTITIGTKPGTADLNKIKKELKAENVKFLNKRDILEKEIEFIEIQFLKEE